MKLCSVLPKICSLNLYVLKIAISLFTESLYLKTSEMSSAAGDREQKMLDSTTENLSQRLTEVRKTLGTLIAKVHKMAQSLHF